MKALNAHQWGTAALCIRVNYSNILNQLLPLYNHLLYDTQL